MQPGGQGRQDEFVESRVNPAEQDSQLSAEVHDWHPGEHSSEPLTLPVVPITPKAFRMHCEAFSVEGEYPYLQVWQLEMSQAMQASEQGTHVPMVLLY
jgi:hypothetical protein